MSSMWGYFLGSARAEHFFYNHSAGMVALTSLPQCVAETRSELSTRLSGFLQQGSLPLSLFMQINKIVRVLIF